MSISEQAELGCACLLELEGAGLPLETLPVVYEDASVVALWLDAPPELLAKASVEQLAEELQITKAVKSHLERHGKWEKKVAAALHRVMRRMARDVARRIKDFESLELTRIFPRGKWWRAARQAVVGTLTRAAIESGLETLRRQNNARLRKQDILPGDLSWSADGESVLIQVPAEARSAITSGIEETLDKDYWQQWETSTRTMVGQKVNAGVNAGLNLLQIADTMDEAWPFSYRRAMLVARTEVNGSMNFGHHAVSQALIEDPRSIVNGRSWISIIDQDTRGSHRVANGQRVVKLANGAWVVQDAAKQQIGTGHLFVVGSERARFPGDPNLSAKERCNCVLPQVVVGGTFRGGLKGWYSGEVVEIATLKGHRATLTVNHPVLTETGLVAAGELTEGDYVVCESCNADGRPSRRDHEEEHAPAEAEKVFNSLCAGGSVRSISPRSLDLDGDEKFFVGQIDGPAVNPSLVLELQAAGQQRFAKRDLVPADWADELPFSEPGGNELIAVGASSSRIPGGTQLTACSGGSVTSGPLERLGFAAVPDWQSESQDCSADRRSRHAEPLGHFEYADALAVHVPHSVIVCSSQQSRRLGAASDWDVELPKAVFQGVTADSGLYGEFLHRLSGKVTLDEIVEIRKFHWAGPVYDFDTTVSYFSAGGIAIRNCRCTNIEIFEGELAGEPGAVQPPAEIEPPVEPELPIEAPPAFEIPEQHSKTLQDRVAYTANNHPDLEAKRQAILKATAEHRRKVDAAEAMVDKYQQEHIAASQAYTDTVQSVAQQYAVEPWDEIVQNHEAVVAANERWAVSLESRNEYYEEAKRLKMAASDEARKLLEIPEADRISMEIVDGPHILKRPSNAAKAVVAQGEKFVGNVMAKSEVAEGLENTLIANARIMKKNARGYHVGHSIYVPNNTSMRTVVHEMGHEIENTIKGGSDLPAAFHKYRVGKAGKPDVNMKKAFGYKKTEIGNEDDFEKLFQSRSSAAYCGKTYSTGETEIISMGLQELYLQPARFAEIDPEYFKFMLGILDRTLEAVAL